MKFTAEQNACADVMLVVQEGQSCFPLFLSLWSELCSFPRAHNRRRLFASSMWETGRLKESADVLEMVAEADLLTPRMSSHTVWTACPLQRVCYVPTELKGLRGWGSTVSLCPTEWNLSVQNRAERNGLRGNSQVLPMPLQCESCAPLRRHLSFTLDQIPTVTAGLRQLGCLASNCKGMHRSYVKPHPF